MLPHSLPALVFALLSILPSAAIATDRYYLDSSATSPSGRYRIDAQSPDNAGPRPRPFASNFNYTLTDNQTGKVLWQRKQPMSREKGSSYSYPAEGSPMRVFVNDDGVVAAYLAHESLLLLDAKQGRKIADAEILEAFPKSQQDQFVSNTTAGPMWTHDSDWSFLTLPAPADQAAGTPTTYFIIRPYWHHRLIINTGTGKHVDLGTHHAAASTADLAAAPAETRRLLAAVLEDEQRRALSILNAPAERLDDDKDRRARWDLATALHTASFLKPASAVPHLRALETSLDHKRDPYSELRPKLRQALRALGEVPAPGFGIPLFPLVDKGMYSAEDTDHPYTTTVPLEARAANAPRITAGMSVKELTDLLGCPDAELYDGDRCYDYDIDPFTAALTPHAPYTLRIQLDRAGQTIKSVRIITPFAFLHDAARIRGY